MSKPSGERTIATFLTELADTDQTISGWAQKRGFCDHTVYSVIAGRAIGRRGESRRVLREMGLPLPAPLGMAGRAGAARKTLA